MQQKKTYNKTEYVDAIFFGVLLVLVSVVTLILFYRQTLGSPESGYHSDMKAYILEMQGEESGYSFPYPVFFRLAAFFHLMTGAEPAVALATMVLNSLALFCMKWYLNRYLLKPLTEGLWGRKWLAGCMVSLLAAALFFVSMLYPPESIYLPGIKRKYLGVFTPNPFHNATYLAARPFAILCFFQFAELLDKYEEGYSGTWKKSGKGVALLEYLSFALSLLLATMTKPSFTIVLVGAAGLIMAFRLVKSRFRLLLPALQLGLCFVPTFIDLLYQYKGVFVPEDGAEGGIGFGLGRVWSYHCDNIPLAILLAGAFPLFMLVCRWKDCKSDTLFRFSWQIYFMSLAMAYFCYEKGFREIDFNFSWGYMYGIFFAFTGALIVLVRRTAERRKSPLLAVGWLVFLTHLGCGVLYFLHIFRGGLYY